MHGIVRLGYEALAQVARGLAAVAPDGTGKLVRTLHARRGIRDRFASWARDERDPERRLIWMHAPSVGEGLQARPVLELLRAEHPELQLAYTHFSPSAASFAATLPVDFRDYLPFDTRGDARAAIAALRPTALVFSKLDVWPALARTASDEGVRLGLISATLAEASSRRSGLAAAMLRDAYRRLDLVGAISDEDAERLVRLGVHPGSITVTGDTRYDQVRARAARVDRESPLLAPLRSTAPTLVAGSTWPADERVLLEAWRGVVRRQSEARLIIAPHEPTPAHIEPILRWSAGAGIGAAVLDAANARTAIVVVDRVGVLGDLYALADVAYVGGGFHAAGLHSVLEPAAFGAPVLFGPRHGGSRDARLLLEAGGARSASSVVDLERTLAQWLADPGGGGGGEGGDRSAAGAAARAVVDAGLGAARRSLELVLRLL